MPRHVDVDSGPKADLGPSRARARTEMGVQNAYKNGKWATHLESPPSLTLLLYKYMPRHLRLGPPRAGRGGADLRTAHGGGA